MQEAISWNTAFHLASEKYGKKVKLPKSIAGAIPRRFTPSSLSLNLGANKVYRDQQKIDSYQAREYDNYYTIQLDRYNPEKGKAVQHALTDALPYTAAAVVGVAVLGGSS